MPKCLFETHMDSTELPLWLHFENGNIKDYPYLTTVEDMSRGLLYV